VLLFNVMSYLSFPTRKFILGFSVFIAYWIVFDYMKAFPNYEYNTVHIESLYDAEKNLFGINFNSKLLTPNEYWLQNTNSFLDVLCGIFYLCWVPVPLIFSAYLFFKNREQFMQFALTFFFVNILGFIVYYIYPAAAPWYVQIHGFDFYAKTPGNTAGLQRFDDYFNVPVFQSLYAKSSNVFAAMPSLHSSYPLIVLYYGLKNKLGWVNILFAIIMVGIWFAAVYTSHHYLLDVIAGIICGTVGTFIFQKWLVQNKTFYNIFIKKLIRY
jgi:inositol phosphorylceramide synthase catalytic subunit